MKHLLRFSLIFLLFLNIFACQQATNPQETTTLKTGTQRQSYVISEINSYNSGVDSATLNYKYTEMKKNPYNFYRATAHLYYKDLSNGTIAIPGSWKSISNINTWIMGDLHTGNLGFFSDKDHDIKFGFNDYDESYIAPYYFELLRFCVSIYLLKSETGISDSQASEIVLSFLNKYRKQLLKKDKDELNKSGLKDNNSTFVYEKLKKLEDRDKDYQLKKFTKKVNGDRTFDFSNEKLAAVSPSEETAIKNAWKNYHKNLDPDDDHNDYYKIKSIALRLNSGLGSSGVKKYYVLIEGKSKDNDNDKILEIKEQKSSVVKLCSFISSYSFTTEALRVITANKDMAKKEEIYLGTISFSGKNYSVKLRSRYKFSWDANEFPGVSEIKDFAKMAAIETASCHIRGSDDAGHFFFNASFASTAGNALNTGQISIDKLNELAKQYALQVNTDYNYFKNSN